MRVYYYATVCNSIWRTQNIRNSNPVDLFNAFYFLRIFLVMGSRETHPASLVRYLLILQLRDVPKSELYSHNAITFTPSSISYSAVTLHALSLTVAPLETLRDPSTLFCEQTMIGRELSNTRYGVFMAVYQIVPYIAEDHINNTGQQTFCPMRKYVGFWCTFGR
jgi:hypothetical protein